MNRYKAKASPNMKKTRLIFRKELFTDLYCSRAYEYLKCTIFAFLGTNYVTQNTFYGT